MSRDKAPQLHGVLLVDKPVGWTSHDVVARLRRLTGVRRIGHAGTLDPFATGLLVVAVGRATRLLQFAQGHDKAYNAHCVLGATTDTLDVDGELARRGQRDTWPAPDEVDQALALFSGEIQQVPPKFSAIKVGGRRLYDLARAGEDVDVPTRTVRIDRIQRRCYEPPDLIIEIECGAGTYVRSLARDIGEELGTEAYCHALRRTSVGHLSVDSSLTMADLEAADLPATWPSIALHPDSLVEQLPAVILPYSTGKAWYHGRPVDVALGAPSHGLTTRVYDSEGRFAGIGEADHRGRVQPRIVFSIDGEGARS